MRLPLDGYWQLSPLTDLSIPQADIQFPAPLSQVLPAHLSEHQLAQQEWHLMYDFELSEALYAYPAADLVVGGIDYYAEVRVNGEAVFDCNNSEINYRKDITQFLQQGKNRIEILFLEQEEDWLLEETIEKGLACRIPSGRDSRIGIWDTPYLQFVSNVRLQQITTEAIWHLDGSCEYRVDLFYQVYNSGLVSASVEFNGMTYCIPLDMRSNQATAIFQIEAPVSTLENSRHFYLLSVDLDGDKRTNQVRLTPEQK